jgi:hypothetical protein
VLHAIPERVDELQTLWKRFAAYSKATPYLQMLKPFQPTFPMQMVDPRVKEITVITVVDARSYFDLLLS